MKLPKGNTNIKQMVAIKYGDGLIAAREMKIDELATLEHDHKTVGYFTPSRIEAERELKERHGYLNGPYKPPPSFLSPEEILRVCKKAEQTPYGMFVEVGCYRGGLAYHLANVARAQSRPLYLYDTFTGIADCDPDKGD